MKEKKRGGNISIIMCGLIFNRIQLDETIVRRNNLGQMVEICGRLSIKIDWDLMLLVMKMV